MTPEHSTTNNPLSVTINITAHREGYLLHKTLRATQACRMHAAKDDILTELHIHLDNADELTRSIAKRATEKYAKTSLYENSFGDLSESRNFLIRTTTSKYTLFVDADDLFSEDFISVAIRVAESYGRACIVTAANIFKFGASLDNVVYLPSSTIMNPETKSALFETNLYISQNLVTTSIYKDCLYEKNSSIYGFEDWHWNTKVIERGYEFLVAPKTAFFYRQKLGNRSLLRLHSNLNTIIRSSKLFSPAVYSKLPHNEFIEAEKEQPKSRIRARGREAILKVSNPEGRLYVGARTTYRTIQQTLAPVLHVLRNGLQKTPPIAQGDLRSYRPTKTEIQTWNRLNRIEPIIRIDKEMMRSLKVYEYKYEHRTATAYRKISELFMDEGIDDLILVPWLKKGGADLAIIDMAKLLAQKGRNVLIVATRKEESEWAEKLSGIEGVKFLERRTWFLKNLDDTSMMTILIRMLQNWRFTSLTIMNSTLGYKLIDTYGKIIKERGIHTICHNYAFPEQQGLYIEAFPEMADCLAYVDAVIVDSEFHKQEVQEVYGLPSKMVYKVPLVAADSLVGKQSPPTRKILFANRIAKEKRPDLAIEAIETLKEENITMDLYGSIDKAYASKIEFGKTIKGADNVNFLGEFDGTSSLNFDAYDICLFTSSYEGTPRIAIDAVKANLFIVCPAIGGLPEVVIDGKNGFLLPKDAMMTEYAKAIRRYYVEPNLQNLARRKEHTSRILDGHTKETYEAMITKIYNLKG